MKLRTFALAVSIGLHGLVLWSFMHRQEAPSPSTSAPEPARPSPKPATTETSPATLASSEAVLRASGAPGTTRSPAPTVRAPDPDDRAWRQAYEAGRAWERKRLDWMRRFMPKEYGDKIGALLDLPFKQAWQSLEALTMEGDAAAARALLDLSGLCRPPEATRAIPGPELLRILTHDTEPNDAAFIQGAYEAELATQREAFLQCGPERGLSSLRRLVAHKLGTVPREMGSPGSVEEWSNVWESFRQAYLADAAPEPRDPVDRALQRLSLGPGGPASEQDIDTLLSAIDEDPRALNHLAFCFIHGCNGIEALPPDERLSWSLRAARYGFTVPLRDVVEQTRETDPVTAYQWATFGRMLVLEGCSVMVNAGGLSLAMQQQFEVARTLTPSERALGERRAQELLARYGDAARAAQGCDPAR